MLALNLNPHNQMMQLGQSRVIIENVYPELDGGQYYIKRVVGQSVAVEADILADGHDIVAAILKYRFRSAKKWQQVTMTPIANDRWGSSFTVQQQGMIALIGASAFVYVFMRNALAPLAHLSEVAQQIGSGELSTTVNVEGYQEVSSLASALDGMRVDLQASYSNLNNAFLNAPETWRS